MPKFWPSICTKVAPWASPKLLPVKVIAVPAPALEGETPVKTGTFAVTAKAKELLEPIAFAISRVAKPGVVEFGTAAHATVSFHKEGVSSRPFRITLPAVLPKPMPLAH